MAVGRMAYEAGQFGQAAHHFRMALQLVKDQLLPDELLSQSLVNLAKTLGTMGSFDEAEKHLHAALGLDELNCKVDDEYVVELIEDYHQLSLLYWRENKPSLAMPLLDKAFELLKSHPNVPDELKAKLLKHRVVLIELTGDYLNCEKLINEALEFIVRSEQLGRNALIYGDCLIVKIMLLTELDRYTEAIEIYPIANQILETSRGVAHPKDLEILEKLAELAKRKGLVKNAEALHEQAEKMKSQLKKR